MIGDRRELRLEILRRPQYEQDLVIGTARAAFERVTPDADTVCGGGYDW